MMKKRFFSLLTALLVLLSCLCATASATRKDTVALYIQGAVKLYPGPA